MNIRLSISMGLALALILAFALACATAVEPTAPQQPVAPAQAQPAQPAQSGAMAAPVAPAQPAPAATAMPAMAAMAPAGTGAQAPSVASVRPEFQPMDEMMGEAKYGGTLNYVPQGSIKIIDPIATGAIVTGTVGRHAYDQLFWRDRNYNIFPQMLDSWEISEDGTAYTFKVRAGQTFHNGDPLRMVDIAESHNRFARVDPLGRQLLGISAGNEGVETPEQRFNQTLNEMDNTITMQFEQPTAMVLEFLAQLDPRQPSIMHEDIWQLSPGEPVQDAIGTGAYMMTRWIPQERLVFEKFPDYSPNAGEAWDFTKGEITQYLDGFIALDIPDHATRVAALQTGEVDVLDDFRLDLAFTLEGNPNIEWSPIRDGNYGVHAFNFRHPPFDNTDAGRLARRAVYAAAPNDQIMQAAVGEQQFWTECYIEIHCGTPWKTQVADDIQEEGIKTFGGNLDLARSILDEAAALDPMIKDYPVRLIAASDMPFMPEAGLVMHEALKDVGFTKVELVSLDWASRIALTASDGPWEIATSWSNFANGLNPLAPSMASDGSGGWEEPRITELRDQFLVETDPEKLQTLFDDMNRVLYDNPARVWHFMFSPPRAIRSDVQNFCIDCLFPILHNVWLDR